MWFFTLVLLGIVIFMVVHLSQRKLKLPGPYGWPFVGNVFQLRQGQSHLTITEWSKKYGNIFQMKMMGEDFIVINGHENIHEALVKKGNDFAGRPSNFRLSFLQNGGSDVAFTTFSKKWVYIKKITIQTLKNHGNNMADLEELTLGEIKDMLNDIREASQNGKPFHITPIIHHCITGILTSFLYGKKEEKEKVALLKKISRERQIVFEPTGIYFLLDIFPWLRFSPVGPFKEIYNVREKTLKWYLSELLERKRDFLPGNPKCFADGLFDQKLSAENKGANIRLSEKDIIGIVRDLIFAGTLTISMTMNAMIIVLINEPEIQQKMADEISEVLLKQTPCLADRSSLQYVEAAILEILRYSSLVPLNLPHYTLNETTVNGCTIPKDTGVIFNLWNLHHDEEYWDNPWKFIPERFLDEEGSLLPPDNIKRKRLMPFGASRRGCPGETLARNRLFLLITSLIQHFQFEAESPDNIPSSDPRDFKASLVIDIEPYKIKVTPRN